MWSLHKRTAKRVGKPWITVAQQKHALETALQNEKQKNSLGENWLHHAALERKQGSSSFNSANT